MSLGDGIPSLQMETGSWFSKCMCSWNTRKEFILKDKLLALCWGALFCPTQGSPELLQLCYGWISWAASSQGCGM